MSGTITDYPFTISLMRKNDDAYNNLAVQHKRVRRQWSRGCVCLR